MKTPIATTFARLTTHMRVRAEGVRLVEAADEATPLRVLCTMVPDAVEGWQCVHKWFTVQGERYGTWINLMAELATYDENEQNSERAGRVFGATPDEEHEMVMLSAQADRAARIVRDGDGAPN